MSKGSPFNSDCWISREAMGNVDDDRMELLLEIILPQGSLAAEREAVLYELAAMQTISRILIGDMEK